MNLEKIKEHLKNDKTFCGSGECYEYSLKYAKEKKKLWLTIRPLGTDCELECYIKYNKGFDNDISILRAVLSLINKMTREFKECVISDLMSIEQ